MLGGRVLSHNEILRKLSKVVMGEGSSLRESHLSQESCVSQKQDSLRALAVLGHNLGATYGKRVLYVNVTTNIRVQRQAPSTISGPCPEVGAHFHGGQAQVLGFSSTDYGASTFRYSEGKNGKEGLENISRKPETMNTTSTIKTELKSKNSIAEINYSNMV